MSIARVNTAKVQWKNIIQLRLPLSLTNPNHHHPKTPLTPFPGNRKSQLSQSAMEEHHPVAIATFPHQPKQPPPQTPTNPLSWQSQKSTQPKCNGRPSSSCDCHFPSPTQTTTTSPKAH